MTRLSKLIFICLILFPILVFARGDYYKGAETVSSTAVCAEDYAPSLTVDGGRDVGRYNNYEFTGFIYIPTSNKCVCYVDVAVQSIFGDPTGINYHLAIYEVDGSNQLNTYLGVSSAVAGGDLVDDTWISANAGTFDFSTCIDLESGHSYGFAIFPDQDANLTDDPEIDGTNAWAIALDNENNGGLIHSGRFTWTYSAVLPHTVQSTDAEDDILVKIGDEN